MPLEFVSTVALPLNVPLAPLPGAVNVTLTFDTGSPAAFLTSTAKFVPKAVLGKVDCGVVPLTAVTVTGASSS